MIFSKPSFAKALENAYQALKTGKKNELRFWARKAIEIKPQDERPWLLLAAIATPKASLEYLQKALKINPNSKEAQKGIAWSKKRIEKEKKHPGGASRRGSSSQKKIKARTRRFSSAFIFPLTIILLLMSSGFVAGFAGPPAAPVNVSQTPTATMTTIPNTLTATAVKPTLEPTQEIISSPTEEPTQHRFISDRSTLTASPTNTATITPTPTATFTASATFTPTATSPPTETYTPPPPPPTFTSAPSNGLPAGVGTNDIWVDVNLSQQSMTVYRGHTALDSFLVSTGMWSTPTVVGTFQVYTMLTAQTMVGPGYFLPDVPYVMYFYQGYALHGTYWHSNFGTQMSHGCVNMRTSEAGWLFNLVQIGTVVNVHY